MLVCPVQITDSDNESAKVRKGLKIGRFQPKGQNIFNPFLVKPEYHSWSVAAINSIKASYYIRTE
jgi:hypothetical protein